MMTRPLFHLIRGLALGCLATAFLISPPLTRSQEREPWEINFMLRSLEFPLVTEAGQLVIWKVPARTDEGPFPEIYVKTLASPLYVTTAYAPKRGLDLNAITRAGITLSVVPDRSVEDREPTVIIDVSKARPVTEWISVEDVVVAAITCLRLHISWGGRSIEIKIEGAKDPAAWKRHEGPLFGRHPASN